MRKLVLLLAPLLALGLTLAACDNGSSSSTPSGPTADTTAPPVPLQLSPASGTVFNHFPRNVTLAWSAVSDPSAPVVYNVEVQFCLGTVASPTSCTAYSVCTGALTSTTCNFNFIGAQPGRWRVRAVDAAGNASAFSDYATFAFSI